MNVGELIEELGKYDRNLPVIIEQDLVRDYDLDGAVEDRRTGLPLSIIYNNATYDNGEIKLHHLTAELIENGFCEEDVGDGEESVVLVSEA